MKHDNAKIEPTEIITMSINECVVTGKAELVGEAVHGMRDA
jgi:hypothetical protein